MYYPLVIKLVYLFFYCCFVFGSQLACSTCQWTSGVLSYCAEKSTHVITTRMAAHHVIHVSLCIRAFMISLSLPPHIDIKLRLTVIANPFPHVNPLLNMALFVCYTIHWIVVESDNKHSCCTTCIIYCLCDCFSC